MLATIANAAPAAQGAPTGARLDSILDMLMAGGPLMIPIGICSVVALAYAAERWLRLRPQRLGTARFARSLVDTVHGQGVPQGLAVCEGKRSSLARVLAAGLRREGSSPLEIEKAVEDAGSREVRRLSANLRPLVVVVMIAPLLGLLGTVWGMIQAFSDIAMRDGLGKPELLAAGISQALITTAAGLSVAIPAQAVFFYYKSRIDRFARLVEDTFVQLVDGNRSPEVHRAHP